MKRAGRIHARDGNRNARILLIKLFVHLIEDTMKDKNGTKFEVGACLKSTQSTGDAGLISCIAINGDNATFTRDKMGEEYFKINQDSMNTSKWVVR